MRLSHDDQMRQQQRLADTSKTGADPEPVSNRKRGAQQVTPAMVNRARAIRPDQLVWRARSQGGMKAFLQTSRTLQRLPAFAKGRRE
jgi:hypothetical protein